MAYRVPNINPLDVGQRVAIGVSIPFNQPQVFTQTYSTSDQIKSDIINFILTSKGERVLNPNFGSTIKQQLFETLTSTSTSNISNLLTDELKINFPSVQINEIKVNPQYDTNTVSITVNYSILGGNPNTLNITL
jgi:phage baseplate assembly protein W